MPLSADRARHGRAAGPQAEPASECSESGCLACSVKVMGPYGPGLRAALRHAASGESGCPGRHRHGKCDSLVGHRSGPANRAFATIRRLVATSAISNVCVSPKAQACQVAPGPSPPPAQQQLRLGVTGSLRPRLARAEVPARTIAWRGGREAAIRLTLTVPDRY